MIKNERAASVAVVNKFVTSFNHSINNVSQSHKYFYE